MPPTTPSAIRPCSDRFMGLSLPRALEPISRPAAEASVAVRREPRKVLGPAGSLGFMEASRRAAGMEATVKDWAARPDEPDVERGSLARWCVKRLPELLGLEVPDASAAPPAPPPVRSEPLPRVGPPPRPAPRPPTQRPTARPARAA